MSSCYVDAGRLLLPPELDIDLVLTACKDFMDEKTLVEDFVESKGHLYRRSPKGTPELAGVGVEYCFGKSKQHFCRENDTFSKKPLEDKIKDSISEAVLPLGRIMKYARRTRSYIRVYEELRVKDTPIEKQSHNLIEKMHAHSKTHRNIGEIERAFIEHT